MALPSFISAYIGQFLENLLLKNHCLNALLFGMEHPWDKEIQICANKVPWVINGPAPGDKVLYRHI